MKKLTDQDKKLNKLLKNLKANLPKLKKLLKKVNSECYYEDAVYRYYHHSFKVYYIQSATIEIVTALKSLAPEGVTFNSRFEEIFKKGTGKEWKPSHNITWDRHTKPLLEAFFHAHYFLEMGIKYGKELKTAPYVMPFGWAAFIYFYNLRY